jgi:hypothetical protein
MPEVPLAQILPAAHEVEPIKAGRQRPDTEYP